MQKNISINISGIIFHIEEAGYEKLKGYLERISGYFSNFDESQEIISDIETRIAEILMAKLNDGKQIINAEDIDSLIATLGSIEDFKAMESDMEMEEPTINASAESEEEGYAKEESKEEYKSYYEGKRLYRDVKRKIIGGVAAGLANYFKVDALWFRLLFLVLFFGLFVSQSVGFVAFLTYMVLWIVLPGTIELEEDKKVKKLYRNPDEKVIAGVSGGLAAYFGIDPAIVRLLFVISIIPGGAGFFAYLILWIITPQAETITEKMKMKGEPITLSNIENNVKKSLKVDSNEEENVLVKILLFPFRLIAMVIEALTKMLGPLMKFIVDAVRIVAGVALILTSVVSIYALIVIILVAVGVMDNMQYIVSSDFPLLMFMQSYPTALWWLSFIVMVVPFVFILLLGISAIAKRIVFTAFVGWSLFALWFVAVLGTSFMIPNVVNQWRTQASYHDTVEISTSAEVLYINSDSNYGEDYRKVRLRINPTSDEQVLVMKKQTAHGSDRPEAIENAKMINYDFNQQDSVLLFPTHFEFANEAVYRNQQMEIELLVPINKAFVLDSYTYDLLSYNNRNELIRKGGSNFYSKVWYFDEYKELKCVGCTETNSRGKRIDIDIDSIIDTDNIRQITATAIQEAMSKIEVETRRYRYAGYTKSLDLADFNSLDVSSIFHVYVTQGDRYSVSLQGREKDVNDVIAKVRRGNLKLDLESSHFFWNRKREFIKVEITMPDIKGIKLSGASKLYAYQLDSDYLDIDVSGASTVEMLLNSKNIDLELSGASRAKLKGETQSLRANISSASNLNAEDFEVTEADIRASGASKATVKVRKYLNANASGASKITYKGSPEVKSKTSGAAKINSY